MTRCVVGLLEVVGLLVVIKIGVVSGGCEFVMIEKTVLRREVKVLLGEVVK